MRKVFWSALGAAFMWASLAAHAVQSQPYSDAALASAQAEGKAVALHFHAEWCGSCKVQSMVFEKLGKEGKPAITVLVVDYDKSPAVRSRFGVKAQSTIVVMKGEKETARLAGEIRESRIQAALMSAL